MHLLHMIYYGKGIIDTNNSCCAAIKQFKKQNVLIIALEYNYSDRDCCNIINLSTYLTILHVDGGFYRNETFREISNHRFVVCFCSEILIYSSFSFQIVQKYHDNKIDLFKCPIQLRNGIY